MNIVVSFVKLQSGYTSITFSTERRTGEKASSGAVGFTCVRGITMVVITAYTETKILTGH